MRRLSPVLQRLATAVIIVLSFWMAVSSLVQKAPTFDEQGFIVRGLAYLRSEENGGTRGIRVGHPAGMNMLSAALLAGDETIPLPSSDPSWQESSFHRPAELFLWEIGNDVEMIMFLARLPTVWLGMLLIALGGRWAADIVRKHRLKGQQLPGTIIAGLVTSILLAFDPNLLASMRLATTDFGLAFAATLAGYTLWRYLQRPAWTAVIMAGAAMGLLQNTKFTALLFVPLFGLAVLIALVIQRQNGQRTAREWRALLVQLLLVYPLVALLTLWISSGFDYGRLPDSVPLVSGLGGITLPLAGYLEQLLDIGGRLQTTTPAFLMGQYSDTGWWTYFPIAFLIKTPLPTLLLLAWMLLLVFLQALRGRLEPSQWQDLSFLLLPSLGYFAIALTSEINLGYRHLLPVLPFFYVLVGVVVAARLGTLAASNGYMRWQRAAVALLLTSLLVIGIRTYPDYLTYFNALAGGQDGGWRYLVDSNLDWGQDLNKLPEWMAENSVETVKLSYFGEGRPEYYGIDYQGLDSFPPRLMDTQARRYYPADPAPGWYAISATNLQGVHFTNHDQFAYFRDKEPVTKLGHSIFLYHMPGRGEATDLTLSGLQVDQLAPEDFARLGTNEVGLRWVDGRNALLVTGAGGWLAESVDTPVDDSLMAAAGLIRTPVSEGLEYRLSILESSGGPNDTIVATFLEGEDGRIEALPLIDLQVNDAGIVMTTAWRNVGQPRPIKLFIHVLDNDGNMVSQWDGLGVAWQGWERGDVLLQRHELDLPETLPSGDYRIVAGVYDPDTLVRWKSTAGDEIVELGTLSR